MVLCLFCSLFVRKVLHHSPKYIKYKRFVEDDGPVLSYSGGVGGSCITFAKQGIRCTYMGIGLIEYAFAEYRVRRLGLEEFVSFLRPYSEKTNWKIDPVLALPRDESFGIIEALDVLEHIPSYEHTVRAMVESLRPGGVIVENTPFAEITGADTDLRIHVSNGGIDMTTAMGPSMSFEEHERGVKIWRKKQ